MFNNFWLIGIELKKSGYVYEHNPAYRSYGIKLDKEALNSLPYNSIPYDLLTFI